MNDKQMNHDDYYKSKYIKECRSCKKKVSSKDIFYQHYPKYIEDPYICKDCELLRIQFINKYMQESIKKHRNILALSSPISSPSKFSVYLFCLIIVAIVFALIICK